MRPTGLLGPLLGPSSYYPDKTLGTQKEITAALRVGCIVRAIYKHGYNEEWWRCLDGVFQRRIGIGSWVDEGDNPGWNMREWQWEVVRV